MNMLCNPLDLPPTELPTGLDANGLGDCTFLIPHPDDEVIGCGGLIALLSKIGARVDCVLVSDGSGAGALPEGTDLIRQKEFCDSMLILNPNADLHFWKMPDGNLAKSKILSQLKQFICDKKPQTLIVPWPSDCHPDHRAIAEATRMLTQSPMEGLKQILFYEVWTPLISNRILDITSVWEKKYAAIKCHKTALSCGQYDRAMEGLAAYRSLFLPSMAKSSTYAEGYYLQDLRQVGPQNTFIRSAENSDQEQMLALFQRVFGETKSADWWQWKYASRSNIGQAAFDQNTNEMVAFYGAIQRDAFWENKLFKACQFADSMTNPQYRKGLGENSVFYQTNFRYLQQHFLLNHDLDFAFGFANEKALKLGIAQKLYRQGDAYFETQIPTSENRHWGLKIREFWPENPQKFLKVNKLFTQMCNHFNQHFLLQRSADYWWHRYVQHPSNQYRYLEIRQFGWIIGYAVLKPFGDRLMIIDLVFRPSRKIYNICDALSFWALKESKPLTIFASQCVLDEMQISGGQQIGWIALPHRQFKDKLSDFVKHKIWITGGDTDYL